MIKDPPSLRIAAPPPDARLGARRLARRPRLPLRGGPLRARAVLFRRRRDLREDVGHDGV